MKFKITALWSWKTCYVRKYYRGSTDVERKLQFKLVVPGDLRVGPWAIPSFLSVFIFFNHFLQFLLIYRKFRYFWSFLANFGLFSIYRKYRHFSVIFSQFWPFLPIYGKYRHFWLKLRLKFDIKTTSEGSETLEFMSANCTWKFDFSKIQG